MTGHLQGGHSPYYANSGRVAVASRISIHVRQKMFRLFMSCMKPTEQMQVLDVGVTADQKYAESNYFEALYPHKHGLTCAGVEDASFLEHRYPGTRFVRIQPDSTLPFRDKQFDIAFSNAVIEHAGDTARQRFFLSELVRVSRAYFVTTPNRWFPIEMHTVIPFFHYLPGPVHRSVLSAVGLKYWASVDRLNLLDASSLKKLFPSEYSVQIVRIRLLGLTSNLVAFGQSAPPDYQCD